MPAGRVIELFEQLLERIDALVAVLESQAPIPASSEDEYVTGGEMARRLGMTYRQFKRAYTEGPNMHELRAVAIKRGVKQWRWPVRKVTSILTQRPARK
jgi:hypothetical protein